MTKQEQSSPSKDNKDSAGAKKDGKDEESKQGGAPLTE
jgi:hypothetical protein